MRVENEPRSSARTGALLFLPFTLALAAACQSAEAAPDGAPLCFHAVLAPITVEAKPATFGDAGETTSQVVSQVALDLDADTVSPVLQRRLEGRVFTRVSCLESSGLDVSATVAEQTELEADWLRRSTELGADILVRSRLQFDPTVKGYVNDRFWLNLPLFLLGGPFCYFIDDRTYEGRAKLVVEFFDLSRGAKELDTDNRILGLPITAEFSSVSLDFIDRAESLPSYALSLLLPAGLLAKETGSVDRMVDARAIAMLADDLARKVQEERRNFHANGLASFYLDEGGVRVQRNEDGTVAVAIPLVLPASNGLRDYSLGWDGGGDDGNLMRAPSETVPEGRRVWLRQDALAVGPDAPHLTVSVGDDQDNRRAYTFSIPQALSAGR